MLSSECIAVTGSAGFIGSHLCQALLAHGARVVGIDNLDPFYPASIKRTNLELIATGQHGAGFTQHEMDISDTQRLAGVFSGAGVTGVVHLAARAGVRPSIADPIGYAVANVVGTQSVLSAAQSAGCDRIVCASSSSVYGNNTKVPFAETDSVERPISPYAATKLSCEMVASVHHHLTRMPTAMLRFFTVFGPRQRPDLAISLFLSRISAGEPIERFGDGSSSRDYTYIDDIVAGIIAAYERIGMHGFRVWNLGGDHPTTLNELIETIGEVVGTNPVIHHADKQPGDVERTWADLTRARAELGYAPKVSVSAGIARQWAWMRGHGA